MYCSNLWYLCLVEKMKNPLQTDYENMLRARHTEDGMMAQCNNNEKLVQRWALSMIRNLPSTGLDMAYFDKIKNGGYKKNTF